MKKLMSLGIAAGMLVAACAAYAYPTLTGLTGNGVLPTAKAAGAGVLNVAADYYATKDDVTTVGTTYPLRLTYGATNEVEASVNYARFRVADTNRDTWGGAVKFATPMNILGFNWSAIGQYASVKNGSVKSPIYQASVLGDRSIKLGSGIPVINGTLGVNWISVKPAVGEAQSAFRVFVGGNANIVEKLNLSAEVQTSGSDLAEGKNLYSAALRYPFNDMISGQIGYTNADFANGGLTGSGDSNLFFGINLTFGGTKAE